MTMLRKETFVPIKHFIYLESNVLISGLTSTTKDNPMWIKVDFEERSTTLVIGTLTLVNKVEDKFITYEFSHLLDIRLIEHNIYKIICNERSRKEWNKEI